MSVDEFPRLLVSDQLPETDKDFTREAAVSEKVLMLMPRVQTRAHQSRRRIELHHSTDLLPSSLASTVVFQKENNKNVTCLCFIVFLHCKKKHISHVLVS